MATHLPVSEFNSGNGRGQAHAYVRDRGFTVVPASPEFRRPGAASYGFDKIMLVPSLSESGS